MIKRGLASRSMPVLFRGGADGCADGFRRRPGHPPIAHAHYARAGDDIADRHPEEVIGKAAPGDRVRMVGGGRTGAVGGRLVR